MAVSKVPNCALLLHVDRNNLYDTPMVRLTVTPIAMGQYMIGSDRSFTISTPDKIDPGAPFPVFPED